MPVEIIPHLWLGDSKDAEQVQHCNDDDDDGVALVVNCTRNIPFFSSNCTNMRVAVDDLDDPQEESTLLYHWAESGLFSEMNFVMTNGGNVLVHCQMGRQRSAATVAAFLMTMGMTSADAMALIKSKKREAFFPKPTFQRALDHFEEWLRQCNRRAVE